MNNFGKWAANEHKKIIKRLSEIAFDEWFEKLEQWVEKEFATR